MLVLFVHCVNEKSLSHLTKWARQVLLNIETGEEDLLMKFLSRGDMSRLLDCYLYAWILMGLMLYVSSTIHV